MVFRSFSFIYFFEVKIDFKICAFGYFHKSMQSQK